MKPIIIYGAQGSGKQAAEDLLQAHGLKVGQEWAPGQELAAGDVVTTNVKPPYIGVDALVLEVASNA